MEAIKNIKNWSYRWLGFWKEYGPAYDKYPSAFDFVDKEKNLSYDKAKLKQYLENGLVVVSTSRMNFPSPFTGKRSHGSISFRTDGTLVWFDDLFEYIDQHYLAIPDEWHEHIKKNNYKIPDIDDSQLEKLERPNL